MGDRANLIIVENGRYELYYDHWCAATLDRHLFWGPERAIRFFRDHERQNEDGWLDTIWCEGGAVIDVDKRALLFFGDGDTGSNIPLRRVYFDLLAKNWPGYQTGWAYEGIVDLARYVGYDEQLVISPRDIATPDITAILDWNIRNAGNPREYAPGTVLSVKSESATTVFPLDALLDDLLWCGDTLLPAAASIPSPPYYDYRQTPEDDFPNAGMHIDQRERYVYFWSADSAYIDPIHLQHRWPGWRIERGFDTYRKHAELAEGAFAFPCPNPRRQIDRIRVLICQDKAKDGPDLDAIAAALGQQGQKVEITPAARHTVNDPGPPLREQHRLFDAIASRYLASLPK